jgi:hypothetical protein
LGAAILLSLYCAIALATADQTQEPSGQKEFLKAVGEMMAHPSTDTTPVEFSVGGVQYRMPRNYLIKMENWNGGPQALVSVRVNLPDLKPLTEETRTCFTILPTARPPGCDPFEFNIEARGMFSADEAFANVRDLFHSQKPIEGSFRYEKYEVGPEDARVEYYRKVEDGRTLLYSCQIFDNHGKRDGVCDTIGDRVSTGGELAFHFFLGQLADIDKIDASLRRLVESFTMRSGEQNDPVHAEPSNTNSDQHGD